MDNNKYEGWSNYETSIVAHWINNETLSQRHWRSVAWQYQQEATRSKEITQKNCCVDSAAQYSLADELEEVFSHHPTAAENSVYGDLLKAALSAVNWQEIAENLLDNAEPVEHPVFGPVISAYSRQQAPRDAAQLNIATDGEMYWPVGSQRGVP